jgi:hypothetical protein
MFGESKESVYKALGKPLREKVEEFPNRHDETQKDFHRTFNYSGVTIVLHETPSIGKTYHENTTVSRSGGDLVRKIWDLWTIGRVEKELGPPDKSTNNELIYSCDTESGWDLTIKFKGKNVVQVEWNEPVD